MKLSFLSYDTILNACPSPRCLMAAPVPKINSETPRYLYNGLIEKVFVDIEAGRDLAEFQVAKEARRSIGSAIVDSVILEPNISGIGFSFNKLWDFLRSQK